MTLITLALVLMWWSLNLTAGDDFDADFAEVSDDTDERLLRKMVSTRGSKVAYAVCSLLLHVFDTFLTDTSRPPHTPPTPSHLRYPLLRRHQLQGLN